MHAKGGLLLPRPRRREVGEGRGRHRQPVRRTGVRPRRRRHLGRFGDSGYDAVAARSPLKPAPRSAPWRTSQASRRRCRSSRPLSTCEQGDGRQRHGTYLVTKAFLPDMIEQGWGRIVNMSSVSAQRGGGVFGSPYSSAKLQSSASPRPSPARSPIQGVTVNADTGRGRHQHPGRHHAGEGGQAGRRHPDRPRRLHRGDRRRHHLLSGQDASYLTGTTVDINGGSHIH